jgi:Mat/Ecp fimbriae major subunit
MNNLFRITSLAATVAALALTAAPAQAATPTTPATAKVKIMKAVTISRVGDLDFGTVVLSGPAGFTGAVVSVDSGTGARTCDANLTCSGTSRAAEYKVTGSNNATVNLSIPASVVIDNVAGAGVGDTLTVTLDNAQTSIVLTSSGLPGDNFTFGGSISLDETTADGDYEGDIVVTANYPA